MSDVHGKKAVLLVDNYFEQAEFTEPKKTLEDAGASVTVVSPSEELQALNHVDKGGIFHRDVSLEEVNFGEFDALVLPGGAINADHLRMNEAARAAVRSFMQSGKPLAVICHAPWVLVSADCVRGKRLTSYETIQDDIRNAGGDWVDEAVVINDNLITSRKPDDIPAFNKALVQMLGV